MSLIADFDTAVTVILSWVDFDNRIAWRMLQPRHIWRILSSPRLVRKYPEILQYSQRALDVTRARKPDWLKEEVASLMTDDERAGFHGKIALSDDLLDALSSELEHRLPGVNFGVLARLAALRKERVSRVDFVKVIGALFGLGGLLMQSIPEAVVVYFNYDYKTFQIWTFLITTIIAGYFAIVMLPAWFFSSRAQGRHQYVLDVLTYTAIRLGQKD